MVQWTPGTMILAAFILLLIFGRHLLEIAKNLGIVILDFKKGLAEIDKELKTTKSTRPPVQQQLPVISQQPLRKLSPPPNTVSRNSHAQPSQAVQAGGVATDPNSAHQS